MRLYTLVLIVTCAALWAADPLDQQEAFAWAEDRTKALARFTPGSEQHWYLRCLLLQHQGNLPGCDAVLADWTKAEPNSTYLQRMRLRQAALWYNRNPEQSCERLISELRLDYPSQPPEAAAAEKLGAIDEQQITWEAFRDRAIRTGNLTELTQDGMRRVLREVKDDQQRAVILDRLTTPGAVGLVEAVIADLLANPSTEFGQRSAHD